MSKPTLRRLNAVKKRLVPPAVVPLIEAFTSDGRKWNSAHRTASQDKLLFAVSKADTIEALREWILSQRYSGVLVETWFAFRCFRVTPEAVLPKDDLVIAKLVIEGYVQGFRQDYC